MTGCVFCAIVGGERTADAVLEDDSCLAILDHRPLFPGHCLLLTRTHHATLADLPGDLLRPLFASTQLLARAVESALGAEGTFVAINNRVSQSVPHLHVHVVPRRRKDGLRGFFWPRQAYEDEAHRRRVAERIREAVSRLRGTVG